VLEIFNQAFKLWCRNENYRWRQTLLCRSHNSNNNLGRPTPTAIYQNSWTWSEQSSSSSACFTTRSIAFWMGDATYKHCKSILCWSQYKDYNLGWYEIHMLLDASILHSRQFFNAMLSNQIRAFLVVLTKMYRSTSETSVASWFTLDHSLHFDQFLASVTSKFEENIFLKTHTQKLCDKPLLIWRSVLWLSLMEKTVWIMVVYPGMRQLSVNAGSWIHS
jgi:hypothetical protein